MAKRHSLPVDPARLKEQFPELAAEELEAYVAITRRVLAKPEERARAMRELMAQAGEAERKAAAGERLKAEEALLVRYLRAVSKMQRSTVTGKPLAKD
jgi:hypothetical protein